MWSLWSKNVEMYNILLWTSQILSVYKKKWASENIDSSATCDRLKKLHLWSLLSKKCPVKSKLNFTDIVAIQEKAIKCKFSIDKQRHMRLFEKATCGLYDKNDKMPNILLWTWQILSEYKKKWSSENIDSSAICDCLKKLLVVHKIMKY